MRRIQIVGTPIVYANYCAASSGQPGVACSQFAGVVSDWHQVKLCFDLSLFDEQPIKALLQYFDQNIF